MTCRILVDGHGAAEAGLKIGVRSRDAAQKIAELSAGPTRPAADARHVPVQAQPNAQEKPSRQSWRIMSTPHVCEYHKSPSVRMQQFFSRQKRRFEQRNQRDRQILILAF